MDHRDVTRREFARQLAEFERPDAFFGDGQILEWIAAHVPVDADDVVLDVAGGAGHLGRAWRRARAWRWSSTLPGSCWPPARRRAGARHDVLERLRDPSHTRALTTEQLPATLADIGATVVAERDQRMPAEPWLARAASPDAPRGEILAALEAEADGGPPTGLHAHRGPHGLVIAEHWVIAAGSRPDAARGTRRASPLTRRGTRR